MSGASTSVYDGQRVLGRVVERDPGKVEAFNTDGQSLGLYPTRKAAVAAIPSRGGRA